MTGPAARWSGAATVVLLTSCLVGGTAGAYWTSPGSGSGTATSGTLVLEVTAAAASASLYPGESSDLLLDYALNGPSAQVTGIVAGSITPGGCAVYTAPSSYTDSRYLLSGTGRLAVPGALTVPADAPSSCQGQTLSVPVTVTVQR